MPAIEIWFAAMARSCISKIFMNHGLACDHQWSVRCQPDSDLCSQHIFSDLRNDILAVLRLYPHQRMTG